MKKDQSASFKQSTLLPWIELRIANQSTACYDAHSHDEFSFGIIQQGRAQYRNRQQEHRIGTGDIVTINPSDVHSCNPERGKWSYSMLFVDALELGEVQADILQSSRQPSHFDYQPFAADCSRDKTVKHRYVQLFQSLNQESNPLRAQSCLYDFVETAFSLNCDQSIGSSPPSLRRIKEALLDDIRGDHQLSQLATEVEMSRYQFLRAFKHQFGLPPHAYLMDEKIKRAKVMLKKGLAISDVAYTLGFSDQAHFHRHFKKRLAVTPKYYQSHFIE